jgi:hypothetical protein
VDHSASVGRIDRDHCQVSGRHVQCIAHVPWTGHQSQSVAGELAKASLKGSDLVHTNIVVIETLVSQIPIVDSV